MTEPVHVEHKDILTPTPRPSPVEKLELVEITIQNQEGTFFMNTDKITSIAGGLAVVCGAVVASGVLVPATTAYIAVVAVGSIAGSVFAWFTNKPNPFEKPKA